MNRVSGNVKLYNFLEKEVNKSIVNFAFRNIY